MASKETSYNRGRSQPCEYCRQTRWSCVRSVINPRTCTKCLEAEIECSLSPSRMTPSRGAKRKIEQIRDTANRESFSMNRASSSATASHNPDDPPTAPPPKKSRNNKPAQPATLSHILPAKKRQNISPNACGICLKGYGSSGAKGKDKTMLQCNIKGCQRWYHLSCIQFKSRGKQIFQSHATGTENFVLFCLECFNPKRKDLVDAVAQAESDFKMAMERIKQAVTAEKEGCPKPPVAPPPQEQEGSHTFEHDTVSLEMDAAGTTEFELAKEERYQGFQVEIIESLLVRIEQHVFDYDREIEYANALFLDGNEVLKWTPLKVWDQIDPGQHFVSGKDWFHIDGTANNLSESHAPITAALRRMLRTPDDKPLQISPDLEDLTFSHVHKALINWFVFDLLNNELNLYHFPNMKPLRATQAAMANFGDARWKDNGQRVLREVKLRAWHKTQFREEVIEKVAWQGQLIRRLEGFLAPMTRKIGKINSRSESRANIIKHAIELWSYLDAAHGELEIIHPTIGAAFDGKTCEKTDDELQSRRFENMKVKWVLRPGFKFEESSTDRNAMPTKALVVIK